MRFPGGKNKCFQRLINLIPPHGTYIETHLGSGAVMRFKKRARRSIAFERDPRVVDMWLRRGPPPFELICGDALIELDAAALDADAFVYVDPPYDPSTRRRPRVYRFDYSQQDHENLLGWLRSLRCNAMISGYRSDLYDSALSEWRRVDFRAKTHQGVQVESVWMNYAQESLHDASYVGDDYRRREQVRRLGGRWAARFSRLPRSEQQFVLEGLLDIFGGALR